MGLLFKHLVVLSKINIYLEASACVNRITNAEFNTETCAWQNEEVVKVEKFLGALGYGKYRQIFWNSYVHKCWNNEYPSKVIINNLNLLIGDVKW